MEINLNKEEITETSEFVNFSIREYVAEIRKKDRKKCWPFGSLGDPDNDQDFSSYQSAESSFLSSQTCPGDIDGSDDTPEHTDAPNDMIESRGINDSLGKTVCNGSSDSTSNEVNNTECQNEISVAADYGEPERNRPQKKPQKFRLLSDIYKQLEGLSGEPHARDDIKNPDNVNSRFATETGDELDDNLTLGAIFRKRKGVEVTPAIKKKRKTIRIEEPRVVQDKKSKRGSKDSHGNDKQTMVKRKKHAPSCLGSKENVFGTQKDIPYPDCQKSNINVETETANEDSEMGAVMLLAWHFNKDSVFYAATSKKFSKEKLETTFCSVQMDDQSKVTARRNSSMPPKGTTAPRCSVNRNPADFNIPDAENEFMRGAVEEV